jgi:hypothetical protein
MKKVLIVICMLTTGSLCRAQAPSLGAAASFAVLGGTNVTCTAPGVITGDVGVSPAPPLRSQIPDARLRGQLM